MVGKEPYEVIRKAGSKQKITVWERDGKYTFNISKQYHDEDTDTWKDSSLYPDELFDLIEMIEYTTDKYNLERGTSGVYSVDKGKAGKAT